MISFSTSEQYLQRLGNKIKLYRVQKGLTQQDLEDKSGVSKRSISRLELGASVQLDNLFKILIALGIDENIDLLIPDETKRPSYHLAKERQTAFTRASKGRILEGQFVWGEDSDN